MFNFADKIIFNQSGKLGVVVALCNREEMYWICKEGDDGHNPMVYSSRAFSKVAELPAELPAEWETVEGTSRGEGTYTQRLEVPGGWLYKDRNQGYPPTVIFVREA